MLNKPQRFLLFTIALASLILAPACGHAYRTGDDYPIEYRVPDKDTLVECWNFYNRECTSFAAWCLNSRNGIEFSNQYNIRADGSAGGYAQWGNAANWGYQAEALGYTVDRNPAVGSIYWSASGTWGHVAWVSKVEGTHVWAEDYNFNYAGEFRAFDFDLTDPSCAGIRFIHIADISTPVLTDYAQPSEGSYFLRSAAVEDRREGYLSADGNENYWGANVGVSSYNEQKRLRLSVVQTDNVMNGYMIFPSYSDFAIGADGRIVNANGRRAFHTANTTLYGNDAYYWYFQGHWFSASKWLFEKVGYYYAIRNKNNPNLVLAVDGNNVYLQAYNGSASQLWELLHGDEDPTRPVYFGINYYLNSGKQYDNQLDSAAEQIASEKRARFSDYVIRTEIPTLPGRTFLGWSTDENATEGDPRYAPGSLYTEDKPLNLWAVWQSGTSSGGNFVFGQWEQDGDTSNGAEPLHWRILYEEGGFKYAICDSIIEIRAFGGGLQNWERSNLRSWLNGEFYQTAFNDSEKAKIVKRDQLNLGNDFWIASDDRGTADFVFLPSQKEVLQLLPNKNDRRASPSAYARDNAKLGNDIEFVSWWLRTNGIFIGQAMTVEPNGDINADGQYGGDKAGVRPVIWVSGAKNGSDPGGGGGGTVWDVADVPTNAASPMPTLTPVPTNYQPPIADSYATPTPPSSSAGNIAAFPQTAYTNMEKVNVRNAANGEKITRIEERGTAITVLGETADTNGTHWYSVRLSNGVEGYIRADLVSFTFDPSWKTTPAPVVSSSPFSSYLAKTTTKKVNVRTRADGESKTVTQIKDAGTVVTVIGEEYSANGVLWYAVVLADGRNGYIRGDLLERVNGNASTQSPGSMINNAYVSWQDAYGDFIQNQIFLLLDQVYYNPDEIVVAFYDFDNDSVAELMIYNGSEGAETACTYVYTFKWNNVHYIGSIGGTCRWVGDHSVFTANQKPGLYYYLYENNNTCAYYYINGNGIVAEKASLDSEIVGDAEEYIRWYSLSEIAKIGWNKFIYAPFFDTILDVDYSVPEVFFPGEPVSFEITINDGTGPFLIGYTFNSHIEDNNGDHSTEIFRNNNTLSGGERIYKASFVPDNTVGELEIYIWITDYYGTTNERPEFYRLISRGERDSEQGQHTNNHQNGSGENAVLLPLSVKVTADREIITSITPVHYSIDVIGGTPPYDIVWDAYVIGVSRAEYTDGVTTDQNHIDVFYEWDAPTEGLVFQVAVYDAEHSYAIDDIVLNDSYNIEKNGTEYRAICIGENYNSIVSDVFKGISQLHGCVPDAERLSVLLSTNGGYDVQFLPNASKLSVINAIQTHFKDADENDVSLFFYSGHGYKPEMGSLVTFEGTTLDGYVFNGLSCTGSINIQELMNWLSNVKGIKIIILDSCYSGSFVQNNPYLDDSVIIMAACTNDQTAMETSAVDEGMLYGVTGVFSMYLRDGIDEMKADANNDFRISAAEIADYVNNAVNAAKYEQRCVFYNCTDDFIIVEKELPHIFR